jgi:hypothetical protein
MGCASGHRLMSLRARRSVNAWYGSLYDVTELRRTAEALEASLTGYRLHAGTGR